MRQRGFTLVELMVSLIIFALVISAVVGLIINSEKTKQKHAALMEAQQNAQVALDVVMRDIRSTGYGIPKDSAQLKVAYAAPFECIFNTNISPYPDSIPPRQPRAYDPSLAPACPNYNPGRWFRTGVETYRYTLDFDNDGSYFSGDNALGVAAGTRNPNDYLLVRQTYGRMNNNTNNVYPVQNQFVALVRGPANAADNSIVPMFQYWYRSGTQLLLLGDDNADSVLTGNERLFASPSANILGSIEEITVTITTETTVPVHGANYGQSVLSSRTNLANVPVSAPKFAISGQYRVQATSSGIADATVHLSNGKVSTTNGSGNYEFLVSKGSYRAIPEKLFAGTSAYYLLIGPQDSSVIVNNACVPNVNFDYCQISNSDMCHITGKVFKDSISPVGSTTPQTGERGISGTTVSISGHSSLAASTLLAFSARTDNNGNYAFHVPIGAYTVSESDSSGYYSTTPNDTAIVLSSPGTTVGNVNFGDNTGSTAKIKVLVWNDANKDRMQNTGEAALQGVLCLVAKGGALGTIVASGQTDATGYVNLTVQADSVYSILEIDPDTMISTCSVKLGYKNPPALADSMVDTINLSRIDNVTVPKDSTYRAKFGDVSGFVVIELGTTERVMSLITPRLGQKYSPPGDKQNLAAYSNIPSIVLGTEKLSGHTNMLVWYSRYQNSSTSWNNIYVSNPDSMIDLGNSVPALASADLNPVEASNCEDIINGLVANSTGYNLGVRLTNPGSSPKYETKGIVPKTATGYSSNASVVTTDVLSLTSAFLANSTRFDFAVGTKTGNNSGEVEIWKNNTTAATPANFARDVVFTTAGGSAIGEVRAVLAADILNSTGTSGTPDGLTDLIVGTKTGSYPSYYGQIIIYRQTATGLVYHQLISVPNAYVNALAVYKTSGSCHDILAGLRTTGASDTEYRGAIHLWRNNNNGTFGLSGSLPNDQVEAEGEVLCLATGRIDLDNIPDIVAGIKTADNAGGVRVYYTDIPGTLPLTGSDPSGGRFVGEVVAVQTPVLRPISGKIDIVAAERYLSSGTNKGRIVIYYNKN